MTKPPHVVKRHTPGWNPQLPPNDLDRCESVTGGGRYRCTLPKGHDGKHSDYPHSFTTWSDA